MKKGKTPEGNRRTRDLPECSFNEIEEPGAYILLGSGDLVRVPREALANGHSPLVSITSHGDTRVAKLADDPVAPIGALRRVAADCDLQVNF